VKALETKLSVAEEKLTEAEQKQERAEVAANQAGEMAEKTVVEVNTEAAANSAKEGVSSTQQYFLIRAAKTVSEALMGVMHWKNPQATMNALAHREKRVEANTVSEASVESVSKLIMAAGETEAAARVVADTEAQLKEAKAELNKAKAQPPRKKVVQRERVSASGRGGRSFRNNNKKKARNKLKQAETQKQQEEDRPSPSIK